MEILLWMKQTSKLKGNSKDVGSINRWDKNSSNPL